MASPTPSASPLSDEVNDRLNLEIADEEGTGETVIEAELVEPPGEWIQRAPSYREWTAARDRAARTRANLESGQAQTEAMRSRLDRAKAALEVRRAGVVEVRTEEAQLVSALRRAQLRGEPGPQLRGGPRPRLKVSPASHVESFRPSEFIKYGLGGSVLLALLLAWWIDRRDPAIHELEDLSDLRVPVLGVIPHLR
ncbi:MAG: hypothetical protein JKY65_20015 [Planctomycetes bacterium]|nr:hypothetical protein [Planctomycetota bacterium]